MKVGKRHLTEGMEPPSQDKIRTLAEKETYKDLGILEADIIKKVQMKDKIKKEYLKKNFSRQNYRTETLSKEYTPEMYPSLDIWDPLWSGPEKNLSKWTKEQGN